MSNKKKYTSVSIEKEIYDELTSFCRENGYSVSGLIRTLVLEKMSETKNTIL